MEIIKSFIFLCSEREDIALSLETGQFFYRPRNKYIQEEDLAHIS